LSGGATKEIRTRPTSRLEEVTNGRIAATTDASHCASTASAATQSRPGGAASKTTGSATQTAGTPSSPTKSACAASETAGTASKSAPLVKLPKSDGVMSGQQGDGKKPDGEMAHFGSHLG
jgi:hypothetical protein